MITRKHNAFDANHDDIDALLKFLESRGSSDTNAFIHQIACDLMTGRSVVVVAG